MKPFQKHNFHAGKKKKKQQLARCRWSVEGDLWAVRAEHGVPAASNSKGVLTVRFQVVHQSTGPIHPVRSPPDTIVLSIPWRWRAALSPKSERQDDGNKISSHYNLWSD